MTKTLLDTGTLAHSDLECVQAQNKNKWVEPENPQKTFLKDYRRNTLELVHENDTSRGMDDNELHSEFIRVLNQDGFTEQEIENLKQFYSQNLCSFLVSIIVERLFKMDIIPAQEAQETQNRRILIRKVTINGETKIIAEAEYWDIRCYDRTNSGKLNLENRAQLIPGKFKSVYTLEPTGFTLSHIEASNSHIAKLITGESIESMQNLCENAAEEEFTNSMDALEQAERNVSEAELTELVQPDIRIIRKELQRQHRSISKEDVGYVEETSKLSVVANRVVDAISMPLHIPTVKRLAETASDTWMELDPAKPSKLKWALIGVSAVLVIGICVTASVFSFGAAAPPAIIAGIAAAGVASQAASIVLGTGAVATAAVSAKKINEPSTLKSSLKSISQKFGLFSSNMGQKREEQEMTDSHEEAALLNPQYEKKC